MGLIQKLTTDKSGLTSTDGETPSKYIETTPAQSAVSPLNPDSLYKSRYDLNGDTPEPYDGNVKNTLYASLTSNGGALSKLDLNGKNPTKYNTNRTDSVLIKSLEDSTLDLNTQTSLKYIDNIAVLKQEATKR
jgi:hypothetical protein